MIWKDIVPEKKGGGKRFRLPEVLILPNLSLGYRDGLRGADLHAGLAAQTFIDIRHVGLIALHLQDACGADIDAFFIAGAFVHINFHFPSHLAFPPYCHASSY
jgi:hypothetical protein